MVKDDDEARAFYKLVTSEDLLDLMKSKLTLADQNTVRGVPGSYGRFDYQGKRVLDIGGHIGSFAVYAVARGAKKVVSVEPQPRNQKMFEINTRGLPVTLHKAACIRYPNIDRFITSGAALSDSPRANYGRSRLRDAGDTMTSRTENVKVATVAFQYLQNKVKPHIMKIDCEGSEHELLDGFVANEELEAMVMEIHFFDPHARKTWPTTLKKLLRQGFKITRGKQSIIEGTGQYGVVNLARKKGRGL